MNDIVQSEPKATCNSCLYVHGVDGVRSNEAPCVNEEGRLLLGIPKYCGASPLGWDPQYGNITFKYCADVNTDGECSLYESWHGSIYAKKTPPHWQRLIRWWKS